MRIFGLDAVALEDSGFLLDPANLHIETSAYLDNILASLHKRPSKVVIGELRKIEELMFYEGCRQAYNLDSGEQPHNGVVYHHALSDDGSTIYLGWHRSLDTHKFNCLYKG